VTCNFHAVFHRHCTFNECREISDTSRFLGRARCGSDWFRFATGCRYFGAVGEYAVLFVRQWATEGCDRWNNERRLKCEPPCRYAYLKEYCQVDVGDVEGLVKNLQALELAVVTERKVKRFAETETCRASAALALKTNTSSKAVCLTKSQQTSRGLSTDLLLNHPIWSSGNFNVLPSLTDSEICDSFAKDQHRHSAQDYF
jgi:hypothetical protein